MATATEHDAVPQCSFFGVIDFLVQGTWSSSIACAPLWRVPWACPGVAHRPLLLVAGEGPSGL